MGKTLIVLNPHAAGGAAGRVWHELEPLLWELLGDLVIAVTQHPQEVAAHLEHAYEAGLTRVISIGGDGTNHALINELVTINEQRPDRPPMVYGNLPIGTGSDWARGVGATFGSLRATAQWIANAEPHRTDIGLLEYPGGKHYFLNIASAGIGGDVAQRVNRARRRRTWTFLQATISSILAHQPQHVQIRLDGRDWYEGGAYVVAVANGTTFGHGMKIAPDAQLADGLFDVVLIEAIARLRVLAALRRVYDGSHLTHPNVRTARARQIAIQAPAGPLGLELDGEYASGQSLTFTVRPGLLPILY
ncbi:MAG: YegS/Rv2252/BmrU family lipid kinase [Chloroflexi bacterium]|nr:YegS/Rv2252/BmrU family lipid kinase [Chloroflexota bacterium]